MKYFDIVKTEEVDSSLTKRLGYEKIIVAGRDIDVTDSLSIRDGRKAIVRSKSLGILARAMHENMVIGIMMDENLVLGKVIAAARENEKPVFLSLEGLNSRNYTTRLKTLYKLRKLFGALKKAKVETILITLAEDRHSLLSSNQMMEIARFIGAQGEEPKKMISRLGRYNVA